MVEHKPLESNKSAVSKGPPMYCPHKHAHAISFAALVTGIILLSGMLYWIMR